MSDELVIRLKRWATSVPGMSNAVTLIGKQGYLDDPGFRDQCIVDLDATDIAVLDVVATHRYLTDLGTTDASELNEAVLNVRGASERARSWATIGEPPGNGS